MTLARWLREHIGATPPIGVCLRRAHVERWVRVHSLPRAQRYAVTAEQRAEVRRRAWAAAAEVLPSAEPAWLVTGRFDDGARPAPTLTLPEAPALAFDYVDTYVDDLFVQPFQAYATSLAWPHVDFEGFIDAIAEDTRRVVWLSTTTGEVFAPYDGGIDLVLATSARARAVRRCFPSDWYSSRADGL